MKDDQPQASAHQPRRWHHASANSAAAPGSARGRRLFRLSLVLMALVGAALAWLLFWKPYHDPALTTIAITQYTDPRWPPDARAEQDGRALDDVLRRDRTGKEQDLFNTQIKPLLVGQLEGLRTGAPADRAAVIHLASLARTGREGEVFILPADALPDDPKTWVPLTDVLKWVGACPAPHKLLILDLTRPVADARLGILADDVADRVRATLEQHPDLPFFVLCACSPGQVSLVDETLGRSVFGHYLVEGLRGAADGYNDQGQTDGWVSIAELAAYVTAQVDAWSVRRGRRQTPYLWHGAAKDFTLVTSKADHGPEAGAPAANTEYPAALTDGWKQWDDWRRERVDDTAAWVPRQLAGKLLSFEQRWRAGLRAPAEELPAELARLRAQVQQARDVAQPRHQYSLAREAAQRHVEPNQELVNKLKGFWKEWSAKADAAPADPDKPPAKAKPAADANRVTPPKDMEKELAKVRDPFELALAVWELASADDTEPQPGRRAVVLYDWYRKFTPATARSYVEIRFLQRLAGGKTAETDLPPALARNALRMVRAGEKPLPDPRVFPWVRPALTQAQAKRGDAEQLLFTPDAEARADAAVTEALRRFQDIDALLPDLEDAFRVREEAWTLLPAYAPSLLSRLDFEPAAKQFRAWSDAVAAASELDQFLTPPAADGAAAVDLLRLKEQLPRLTTRLRDRLDREGLRPPRALSRLRPLFAPRWSNVNELDALLQLPWSAVTDDTAPRKEGAPAPPFGRAALWQKRQDAARALLEESRKETAKPAGQPVPDNRDTAVRQERARALTRARVALTLLRLGGLSGADKLEQDWDRLNRDPTDAGVQALARNLFEAWNHTAPEQLKKLWEAQDDRAAARLVRVLPAAYRRSPWNAADVRANPEYRLRLRETRAVWHWLRDDCRLRAEKSAGAERRFYDEAAREYERLLR